MGNCLMLAVDEMPETRANAKAVNLNSLVQLEKDEHIVACFDTVYITSNIPLEQQYQEIQRKELETWNAFLRRIHTVTEFRRGMPPREVSHETI